MGIIGARHNALAISAAIQTIAELVHKVETLETPPQPMVLEIKDYPADFDPRGFFSKQKDWEQPRRRNNYKSRRRK